MGKMNGFKAILPDFLKRKREENYLAKLAEARAQKYAMKTALQAQWDEAEKKAAVRRAEQRDLMNRIYAQPRPNAVTVEMWREKMAQQAIAPNKIWTDLTPAVPREPRGPCNACQCNECQCPEKAPEYDFKRGTIAIGVADTIATTTITAVASLGFNPTYATIASNNTSGE